MKDATFGIVSMTIMFVLMGFMAVHDNFKTAYSCSIAEISPDFTTEMREQCRKMNRIKYER